MEDNSHVSDAIKVSAQDVDKENALAASLSRSSGDRDYVNEVLQFLASATPETLGALAVLLGSCIYLVLGRIGLVLIGVVIGILVHAGWERPHVSFQDKTDRKTSLDIVNRLLDLRNIEPGERLTVDKAKTLSTSFQAFRPETRRALDQLVEAVVRDYVRWWYHPILPGELSFPKASQLTLTRFLCNVGQHLSTKRPADSFLDFLTNCSSILIVFLNEIANAISQGNTLSTTEALHSYLVEHPDSNLANVLNEKQQREKFKVVADDILLNFLDKTTYDCEATRSFLKEVLAGVILESALKSCSRPEWMNGWIVYLLEEGELDLSQAIDVGIGVQDASATASNNLDTSQGENDPKRQAEGKAGSDTDVASQAHRQRLNNAEEAMEFAIQEAKRLSQLIAEADARRTQGSTPESPLDSTTTIPEDLAPQITERVAQQDIASNTAKTDGLGQDLKPQSKPSIAMESLLPPQNEEPHRNDAGSHSNASQEEDDAVASSLPIEPREQNEHSFSKEAASSFTSFDQLVLPSSTLAEVPLTASQKTRSSMLFHASIIIFDESASTESQRLRMKPTGDYLIQIEPVASNQPGWMIIRKYTDFETLHEVLRRIAQISGVATFTEQHGTLPNWRDHNRDSLKSRLEQYLYEALKYKPLAESEGMKRFLEKDHGQLSASLKGSGGASWSSNFALESVGKGVLEVLANAPKGVAEGGKVIGGGISGVFSNISSLGQKKQDSPTSRYQSRGRVPLSVPTDKIDTAQGDSPKKPNSVIDFGAANSTKTHSIATSSVQHETRHQLNKAGAATNHTFSSIPPKGSPLGDSKDTRMEHSVLNPSARMGEPQHLDTHADMKLPPRPIDMPDGYDVGHSVAGHTDHAINLPIATTTPSNTGESKSYIGGRQEVEQLRLNQPSKWATSKEHDPLNESETRVAIELLFAVINELYNLSSAWNIRRTLLGAAKTFLLRPGNPSLSSIQSLISESVISANTSDSGIAAHLRKLRENVLPTAEELKAWPPEPSLAERETLQSNARRLLVTRGIPTTLTGVMGNVATTEAMGRLFDCLQVEEISRGLMFALLLQALRAVTH